MVINPMPFSTSLITYEKPQIKDMLRNSAQLFNEVEYLMVKRGLRDADVYHLTPDNYDNQVERIFKDGLVFLPILRSKTYNGFAHQHYPSDSLGSDVMVYGVVARDLDIAKQFKAAHSGDTDHNIIGKLLGYPDCCSEAFGKFWDVSLDPIYEVAEATQHVKEGGDIYIDGTDPRLFAHLRYFGLRVIPWFPCSYDCKESQKQADKWFGLMQELDSELSKNILDLMSKPSSWDLHLGQVLVNKPPTNADFWGYAASYYTDNHRRVFFNHEKT